VGDELLTFHVVCKKHQPRVCDSTSTSDVSRTKSALSAINSHTFKHITNKISAVGYEITEHLNIPLCFHLI